MNENNEMRERLEQFIADRFDELTNEEIRNLVTDMLAAGCIMPKFKILQYAWYVEGWKNSVTCSVIDRMEIFHDGIAYKLLDGCKMLERELYATKAEALEALKAKRGEV